MPADAAGLVWLRQRGRGLDSGASRQGYAVPERALSRVAVLPHAVVEHGHGAGQEFDRDRLALCRTGAGHGIARKYLRTHPPRMASLDPLNHVQVELLKEHRAQNPDEQVLRGIQITINGISAGLRNSG